MLLAVVTAMTLAAAPPVSTTNPAPRALTTTFTYTATIPEVSGDLDLWIPIPSNNAFQTVSDIIVDAKVGGDNQPFTINTEPDYGNRMVHVRSLGAKGEATVTVRFTVRREEARVLGGTTGFRGYPPPSLARCLASDSLVPVGERYAELARDVAGGTLSVQDRMRKFFQHVVSDFTYDYDKKSPKLGEGDVEFVCDIKTGNCSDLHSYIISLARSSGIPAYIEYGFPVTGIPVADPLPSSGTIGGYHCWMWFWDDAAGWIPIDASDAIRWKDAKRDDVSAQMFGNLVLERNAVALSKGRDINLVPPAKQGPRNYFIYPYAEVNGESVTPQWKMEFQLERP